MELSFIAKQTGSIALLTSVALISIYTIYRRFFLPQPIPGIPYDDESAKKLLGDMTALRSDEDGLAEWSKKQLDKQQSPICQVLMGPNFIQKPIVLVADVAETREALLSRSDFDRSSYIIDRFPLFGDFHLNMKTNNDWKVSRNWSKDLLSPQYMNNVASPAIEEATKRLISLWNHKAELAKGKPFDMRNDIKGLSIDVILAFYFGSDVADSILVREIEHVKHLDNSDLSVGESGSIVFPQAKLHHFLRGLIDLSHIITSLYTTVWPPALAAWWTRYISPRSRKHMSRKEVDIRHLITRAVQRTRERDEAKITSGLDYMVWREEKAADKTGRKPKYNEQIMVDEIYGALIAGQHTTSAAIVWILKYLTDYPAVQSKLREEVQSVLSQAYFENRLPTAEEINASIQKLPYLRAVIEEMLRLRQAMIIPRDATRDTELLGCLIPKGTPVFLVCQNPDLSALKSVNGMPLHPLAEYPGKGSKGYQEFDPDRWLVQKDDGETKFDGNTYPQLAFGGGMRACWGRKLADLEMQLVTTLLVWKFDFLDVPGGLSTHKATYDITYRATKGYLNLRSRVN